jgi:hypothetical protein
LASAEPAIAIASVAAAMMSNLDPMVLDLIGARPGR